MDTAAVLDVLRPIWTTKTETASRVRQRIEAVLDYATAIKARTGDNPARWKGHLDHLLAKPSQGAARSKHHAALDWREAPAFMAELAKREGVAAKALAFTILTAARSGEVRGMSWGEIDLEAAGLDRAGRPHQGGQGASRAADSLRRSRCWASPASPTRWCSRARRARQAALRHEPCRRCCERMESTAISTVHGFRSTFRDWAGETTAHPREVIEAALAHQLKDKAEAAYARGDLFAKRRKLMQDWAEFLAKAPGEVVEIRAA